MRCRSAAKFAKEAEKSGVKPDFSSCAAKKKRKKWCKTENVPVARPKKAEKSGVKPDFSFFVEKCKKECKKNSPLRGELALFHQKRV